MRNKGRPRNRGGLLAALAGRQHGVVAARQLLELGYSRSAVARAADAGRLHRVHRGVYAVGHTALSARGHCLAAVLASGPDGLASHWSAAWLWGLTRRPPATPHVTTPARRHPRPGMRTHHARLASADRTVVDAIPLTALPRTLLDLAASSPIRRLEQAIERAEGMGIFNLGPMRSLLGRAGGHPGAGRLRRALDAYHEESSFLRSPLERRFLTLVREAGLPQPSMNHFEAGHELDAYWPDERFAVELDSFEFHRTRAAFERDRLRQEELKLVGIEMLRVTARRLAAEPQVITERLATLLERRRSP
jgi:very-short-patch-repair endonuclease